MAQRNKKKRVNKTSQQSKENAQPKPIFKKNMSDSDNAPVSSFGLTPDVPSVPPQSKPSEGALKINAIPAVKKTETKAVVVKSLLLTILDLCSLLKVSRSTIVRMKDEIPGRVNIGGSVRYHREIIEKWLRDRVEK